MGCTTSLGLKLQASFKRGLESLFGTGEKADPDTYAKVHKDYSESKAN